jgi:hypothetical protein
MYSQQSYECDMSIERLHWKTDKDGKRTSNEYKHKALLNGSHRETHKEVSKGESANIESDCRANEKRHRDDSAKH